MKHSKRNTILTILITLALVFLVVAVGTAQTQPTSGYKTVVPKSMTLALEFNNATVEVGETQGSRVIIETYVSVNGGERTQRKVQAMAAPVVHEYDDATVITNSNKITTVNDVHAEVHYKVFVPKSIQLTMGKMKEVQ